MIGFDFSAVVKATRATARRLALVVAIAGAARQASAAETPAKDDSYARTVHFNLTFANRDLVWHGDPASPTALVYVKPGARPIATDAYVTTLVESHESPVRHYMREARIAGEGPARILYAFTKEREKKIGVIDKQGRFSPNDFYRDRRELLPTWPADASILMYDAQENALYYTVELPGPRVTEKLDFLPLDLLGQEGAAVAGEYKIVYTAQDKAQPGKPAVVTLNLKAGGDTFALASATAPASFRRAEAQLGSFDNKTGTYLTEAAYRAEAGAAQAADPSVTFTLSGQFTPAVRADAAALVLKTAPAPAADRAAAAPPKITIDGNFDDWRNVAGVDDVRGDLVPYLEYVPDVDLLEFKMAHDAEHIYLYARVAGQIGRTYGPNGRSYFYAYMDVDQNPNTGFVPSRDDDCYFGVDLGDDCEVQFEFVDNTLRKTFYGFCGLGGDENILKQIVSHGKSNYGRIDENGKERENYKAEYISRNGVTEITEDLKLGTSDTIRMALSPDGSEVEIASSFKGFLRGPTGRATLEPGRTIDVAIGMECNSDKRRQGAARWGADNTIAIRGYKLRPVEARSK